MGDPACWLVTTCLLCGRFVEEADDLDDGVCKRCRPVSPAAQVGNAHP